MAGAFRARKIASPGPYAYSLVHSNPLLNLAFHSGDRFVG
jgi:hypothetical protein